MRFAGKLCAEITLITVPVQRDKANLTKYRSASAEVFALLRAHLTDGIVVERASIDEAYIDVSKAVDVMMRDQEPVNIVKSFSFYVSCCRFYPKAWPAHTFSWPATTRTHTSVTRS
jgi:nucleotidyltransferase/DNA polymerase involved in DNA repair